MNLRWIIQSLLLLCVCVNAADAPLAQGGGKTSPSTTLLTEYSKILSDFIKDAKAGGSIPMLVNDQELIAGVIRAARDGGMFDTTIEQEFAYAKGTFDDNMNLAAVLKSAKGFDDKKITLAGPTVFLVKSARAGSLKGAGLEIAKRMLQFAERRMQAIAQAQQSGPALKTVSPTLLAEYSAMMSRYLKVARAAGNLPPGAVDDEIIANTVKSVKQSPLLEVTPEVEEAYTGGHFPDKNNADVIADYAALFEKSKIAPPGPALYILNEAKAGRLKGASLEVAVRIISQVGQGIQKAIEQQVQLENKEKPKQ